MRFTLKGVKEEDKGKEKEENSVVVVRGHGRGRGGDVKEVVEWPAVVVM